MLFTTKLLPLDLRVNIYLAKHGVYLVAPGITAVAAMGVCSQGVGWFNSVSGNIVNLSEYDNVSKYLYT